MGMLFFYFIVKFINSTNLPDPVLDNPTPDLTEKEYDNEFEESVDNAGIRRNGAVNEPENNINHYDITP